MDNRYITGQVQVNISNDNSTLNATQTQIINYIESKKIPKMMTPNPIAIKNRVSGTVNKLCGNIGVRPHKEYIRKKGAYEDIYCKFRRTLKYGN